MVGLSTDRVTTGVVGLDDMLHGGLLRGSATLVEGAPGTGKSTVGMQFIYHGATQANEPGLILTFETFPRQYYRDAENFGWDFRALESDNKLRIIMSSPEVTHADLKSVNGRIVGMADQIGAKRVLVDSLSHFERITSDPVELRQIVYEFINGLKRMGLTILLTRENAALLGETADMEEDLAFVVDGYIMLRYVELAGAVRRALLILKLRGSDHAKDIRQYEITGRGLEVRSKFENQQGIMSGSPISTAAEAFVQAFGRKK
ncbi:MAG: ATPase [Anaerolineae bacterium]|nr:ATPase [Anaerolineae bacterium]